jgi:hypothetical protein
VNAGTKKKQRKTESPEQEQQQVKIPNKPSQTGFPQEQRALEGLTKVHRRNGERSSE